MKRSVLVVRQCVRRAAQAGMAATALLSGGCSGDWQAPLDAGKALLREGQYAAAVPQLEKAARRNPSSAGAQANLGHAYMEMGDAARATTALQRASDLAPTDPRPLELLGRQFLKLGRLDDARRTLADAQRRAPDSARIMTARALVEQRAADPAAAQQLLLRALSAQPDYAPALYNLACLNRDTPGGAAAAAAYFGRFLRIAPPADRHAEVARAWMKTPGGGAQADEDGARSLIEAARAAVQAEDYVKALIALKDAARIYPAAPSALWELATLYRLKMDDAVMTRNLLVQFRTRFPQDPRASEAAAYLAALPQPAPSGPGLAGIAGSAVQDARKATSDLQRGVSQHRAGNWAEAAKCYRAALASDRNLVMAAHNLGLVCSMQGDQTGACDAFEYVLKLDSGNVDATYQLALALRARGQTDRAEQVVRGAIAAHPEHALSQHLLGLLCHAAGRTDEARRHFERFIQLAPDDPVAQQTREWLGER
jgi:tetratricopeptide (TPR) repeat protein